MLKRVAHTNRLSSVATLTTEFQTASGNNVTTITIGWKLHEMGFHGRAAGWSCVKSAAIGLWSSETRSLE